MYPLTHCAVKEHLPGLLGRISSGLRAPVHPEVEASRDNKGCEGVPNGALDGTDGIKEREKERNEPNKQRCRHRKQAVSDTPMASDVDHCVYYQLWTGMPDVQMNAERVIDPKFVSMVMRQEQNSSNPSVQGGSPVIAWGCVHVYMHTHREHSTKGDRQGTRGGMGGGGGGGGRGVLLGQL